MFKLDETIVQNVLDTIKLGLSSGLGVQEPGKMCVEAAVCYALGLPHGDDPGCVSSPLRSFKIKINDSNWSSPQARAKGLKRLAIAQLGTKDTLDDTKFVTELAKLAKKWADAAHAAANVAAYAARYAADATARAAADATAYAAARAARYAADRAAADAARAARYAADAARAARYAARAAARVAAADATRDAADATARAARYAADAAARAAAARAADRAAARAAAYDDAANDKADEVRDQVLSDACEDVVQLLISMNAPGTKYLHLTEK